MYRRRLISVVLISVAVAAFHAGMRAQKVLTPLIEPTPSPTPVVVESRVTDAEGNPAQVRYLNTTGITHFIKRTNELAADGYRLEYVSHAPRVAVAGQFPPPESFNHFGLSAVYRYSPGQKFEYEWFEAHDPGEIVSRIEIRAEKGFRVRKNIPFYNEYGCNEGTSSGSDDQLGALLDMLTSYWCVKIGDVFIMERPVGSSSAFEYKVLSGIWGWGKSPTAELETQLSAVAEKGFMPIVLGQGKVPIKIGTYVLAERSKNSEAVQEPPQYKYIKSEYGFVKKLNKASAEGYRIRLVGMLGAFRHVLLEKASDAGIETYVPIDTRTKKARAALSTTINLSGEYYSENREAAELVFLKRNAQKFDYKLHRMFPEYPKRTKSNPDPKPLKSQEEILREFDEFLEAGYAIKALVYIDGPVVLFERLIK